MIGSSPHKFSESKTSAGGGDPENILQYNIVYKSHILGVGAESCAFQRESTESGEFMEPFWFDVTLNKGYNFLKLKVCDWNTPDQYRESWGAKVTVFRRK